MEAVLERLGSSVHGLSSTEAARRLAEVGPNELARPDKPSVLKLALVQVNDPMNLMLLIVLVVSPVIEQMSTAGVVGFLVLLNSQNETRPLSRGFVVCGHVMDTKLALGDL